MEVTLNTMAIPGLMGSAGDMRKMTSLSSYEDYRGSGVKLLYVDCKKSFKSMYTNSKIKFDDDIETLDPDEGVESVEYFKKRIINNSSREMREKIIYSVKVTNFVKLITDSVKRFAADDFHSNLPIERITNMMQFRNESIVLNPEWAVNNADGQIMRLVNENQFNFMKKVVIPPFTIADITINSNRSTDFHSIRSYLRTRSQKSW